MVFFKRMIVFLLLVLGSWSKLAQGEDSLKISGSSTLLPVAQSVAEVYQSLNSEVTLSVSGTGTGEGIRAIIDGLVDIASASRDLKPEEIKRARLARVELVRHVVALDCLAVVVHPSNPVSGLTLEQLRGIYDGTYKNWRELGGVDKIIVAINRDASSGSFEMWVERILEGKRARRDAQVQSSNGGVAYAVSGNRYAIGYVGLGFISPGVKVLTINGVEPNVEQVINGAYPIVRQLYMFARPDSKVALDFLDFLSGPGRDLIVESGLVPPPAG